jgi:superfamily I DNA/RNA helicase
MPDISMQADEEMTRTIEGRDATYRVFYVGMTRAREELVLLDPAVKVIKGRQARMYVDL